MHPTILKLLDKIGLYAKRDSFKDFSLEMPWFEPNKVPDERSDKSANPVSGQAG